MTPSTLEAWRIWMQTAATTAILLGVGYVSVALCRSPVRQARLAVLTLAGCLLAPILGLVPGLPRWAVRVAPSTETNRVLDPAAAPPSTPAPADFAINPTGLDPAPTHARTETAKPPANPTPTDKPAPHLAIDPRVVLPAAHLVGASAWVGWWCVGQWALRRVVRSARPVPPEVQAHFLAIAGPDGLRVRLLQTDRVRLPITFTWLRPTIILPTDLAQAQDELRFALAHEWSHVERHDYQAWTLASLVGMLAFYNPCYWLLRRQLRLSQDYLADDRAAATESPLDFAAYLVRLARSHLDRGNFPLPALGIGGRRSHLARRVIMLTQDRPPHETGCRPLWTGTVAAFATLVLVVAAGIRLDAAPQRVEPQPKPAAPAEMIFNSTSIITSVSSTPEQAGTDDLPTFGPGSREWIGHVVDQGTGRPIEGAQVRVRIKSYRDPAKGEIIVNRNVRATTPRDGSYRFALTPEEQADDSISIMLSVDHPDHVPFITGNPYSAILQNIRLGERPIFERLEMQPGVPVDGLVLTPDGTPAVGVKIHVYSEHTFPGQRHTIGERFNAKTDAQGRFRLPIHGQGRAALCLLPDQLEPAVYPLLDNRRGGLGTFRLGRGLTIRGKVVDAEGRPVPGIYVTTDRDEPSFRRDDPMPVGASDSIIRTTVTLDDGTFTLAPMPTGPVRVYPTDMNRDPLATFAVHRTLPAAYFRHKIDLDAAKEPEAITIRPAPQVTVTAQLTDSKGAKRDGAGISIYGMLDGQMWKARCEPSPDGLYTMLLPKGLENVSLNLSGSGDGVLMYRAARDAPLSADMSIKLGTLDHDVHGIEIIRYLAPVIWIKAVKKDGGPVPGLNVSVVGVDRDPSKGNSHVFISKHEEDGRYRTFFLPPDREVEVQVVADGFTPRSRKISLPEGKTEEVAFVLEPK